MKIFVPCGNPTGVGGGCHGAASRGEFARIFATLLCMTGALQIDPDITRASTLPASVYADPAIYQRCREQVFAKSWQFVGDLDSVKVPGQVHPVTLLEGCLNEPLLLTRDHSDRLHCLSNVCTHRGNILCHAGGHEKSLICRYHGRRFDLDGTFKHMPEFEQAKGFPSAADNLP